MDRKQIENLLHNQKFFDIREVADIFGEDDFSKLLSLLDKVSPAERGVIFSQAKKFNEVPILRDQALNEAGLHLLRMIIASILYQQKSKFPEFVKQGYTIIENFLDLKQFRKIRKTRDLLIAEAGEAKFHTRKYYIELSKSHGFIYDFFQLPRCQELFSLTNATPNYVITAKRVEKIIHKEEDIQKQRHVDSFHPTIKCWYFQEDVDVISGPTYYSAGSTVLNSKRLEWEFHKSLTAHLSEVQGTAEGSFRVNPEEIAWMGYPEMKPITCSANSLVIFNTQGIHARGQAEPGTTRSSVMGIFRFNPFSL